MVAGVTPCPGGWLVQGAKLHGATFAPQTPLVYGTFLEILSEHPSYDILVVNAPIGYLDSPEQGVRTCDQQARELVGSRGASIHNAPSRAVLNNEIEWNDAGLDAVTATLLPRYREIAKVMSPFRQRTIYEGNPELSFFQINEDTSMQLSKKIEAGHDERREVLEVHIPGIDKVLDVEPQGATTKHVVDALALLWTARRVKGHAARRIPIEPEWDSEGIRMELVY